MFLLTFREAERNRGSVYFDTRLLINGENEVSRLKAINSPKDYAELSITVMMS